MFVVIIPTIGAGLVAASRIMDARHHPFDVITGSLLGTLCAFVAYRQYFPPVSETWRKGRAYPIRSWGRESLPPAEASSTAYEGISRQASGDAQASQRKTTPLPRHRYSESQAALASHAAPIDAGLSSAPSRYPRRRDEWESSSGDEGEEERDFELHQSYPPQRTSGRLMGMDTAYVPRAHLATTMPTTTQEV